MGLQMSYNNYLDADAAFSTVCDFQDPTCVVVKHTNPCGVASRDDLLEAYRLAVRADPISAFGGIVAFNRYGSITKAQKHLFLSDNVSKPLWPLARPTCDRCRP